MLNMLNISTLIRGIFLFSLFCCFITHYNLSSERLDGRTLANLLIRGGVESNLGPVMQSVSMDDQEEVLARLIAGTDHEEIKRMIIPIKHLDNPNHIMTELKKFTVIPLGQLAIYIFNWDESVSKKMRDALSKQGLIEVIQKRLQALNPNSCLNCYQLTFPDPKNHDSNGMWYGV